MPELPEVEASRRLAERAALHRPIISVTANDSFFNKRGATQEALTDALVGAEFVAARRRGKLLMLDTSLDQTLGLHLGMSGSLIVDGVGATDGLVYSSRRVLAEWDRIVVTFGDGRLAINDPRRLGGVELNPDVHRLGVDALGVRFRDFAAAFTPSSVAVKARLMDQSRIAGVGNLIADETFWRAGIDPARPVNSLDHDELCVLHKALSAVLRTLLKRGGSHTGDFFIHRVRDGKCPKDGGPLSRRKVGGRTTFSCAKHQT